MLYLPVRETSEGGRIVEIRQTRDGRRALLAFTALDRLAVACGAQQAWALVATASLDAIQDEQPFDLVAFDPDIPSALVERGRLA
ncbi:SAV_915 family protein [Leucobacter iarius]